MLLLLDPCRLLILYLLHQHLPLRLQVPRPLPLPLKLHTHFTVFDLVDARGGLGVVGSLYQLGAETVNLHLEGLHSLLLFDLGGLGKVLGFL